MMTSASDLKKLASESWYYQIELEEGLFSNGRPRSNAAVYRDFFRRIDVKDHTCLDIGTQEFLSPVVLLRQGAKSIAAYDRLSLEHRYEAVKKAYSVQFDYLNGMPLQDLKKALQQKSLSTSYDIVNFSGVLYHMIDPLAGLAMARSFLRLGGLMILETSVQRTNDYALQFNNRGRIYPGSNYFQISIETLDYWIRMLRMLPLDCAWWGGQDVCRFLVICRAVDDVQPEPDDSWMRMQFIRSDFKPYGLDYGDLASDEELVGYRPLEGVERVIRPGTELINLYETAEKTGRYRDNPELRILKLADQY